MRCSRCSSFWRMSPSIWAGPHVFLPGLCPPTQSIVEVIY
jgi:hypothetical protein